MLEFLFSNEQCDTVTDVGNVALIDTLSYASQQPERCILKLVTPISDV